MTGEAALQLFPDLSVVHELLSALVGPIKLGCIECSLLNCLYVQHRNQS